MVQLREPQGRDSYWEVNRLALPRPQALAGGFAQRERGYNEAGASGVPSRALRRSMVHPRAV
jgi:hypothetical protein